MSTILIKNGTVVDGSGASAYEADILIKGDTIAAIGQGLENQPELVDDIASADIIDAAGKTITPGFINMHSHADCSIAMYPNMESSLGQGITTEFAGHCGLGVAPIQKHWLYMFPEKKAYTRVNPEPIGGINPYGAYIVPAEAMRPAFKEAYGEELDWTTYGEFLDHMRRVGIGANVATVCGQSLIRLQAMGLDYKRPATEEEICAQEEMLREAMDGGALGLGLGLDYQPSLYASHEELVRLMAVVKERGGIVTAHTRHVPNDYYGREINFYEGLKEFLELGLETGAKIHVSHIQNAYPASPETEEMAKAGVEQTLALLEEYRQKGIAVTWDVIPHRAFGPFHYPMVAGMFQPYVEQCGSVERFSQMLRIGNYRDIIETEIRNGNHASRGVFTRFNPKANPNWDLGQKFTKVKDPALLGKTIREAANGQDSLKFLLDLMAEDPYACIIQLNRQPEKTPDRDAFVAREEAAIGLDIWSFDYDACLN
ncbi:MAG: amidohydrolase family protein, partial [Firmicutes bacterium]|nr:amidohydrolase family protein [Bacillota bacterium]